MCRFFGLLGNTPAKMEWYLARAENALAVQSRRDRSGDSHSDGWGIGYYVNGFPLVAWSAAPAAGDGKFQLVARSVRSHAAIAHVRDASVGGPALANTHPFTYGRWLFAHNGTVRPFERVAPLMTKEIPPELLFWRRGNTDSELVFYWLLARMARAGLNLGEACIDLPGLNRLVTTAVTDLAGLCSEAGTEVEPAKLNFLLTDGTVLMATRWRHSLCWSQRPGAILIASEPMDRETWQDVPDSTLFSVDHRLEVTAQPL